jgi:hypothetical protein
MLKVKETAREGEGKQSNLNFNVAFYWVGAALSLSLLTGAIGWSYQLIVRDISQIPIVRAQLGPLRVAPDDPGGLTAANQGLSVTQLAVNDTLEVSTENSLDLKILPEQNATGLAPNNEAVLSTAAFSPKKLEIENAVSLALALTNEVNSSFNSLRPKIRPVVLNQTQTDNIAQSVPNELVVTLPVGSAVVQLGAFESKSLAQIEWQRLEALLGSVLTSKNMVIQKAESGGKVFYRLRAFGFDDLSDARQFCSAVNDKVACIPVVTR